MKYFVSNWKTTLNLFHNAGIITTPNINIKKDVPLRPRWFGLALNPLSSMLRNCQVGHRITGIDDTQFQVTQLLFIDDLKLYANSKSHIRSLSRTTEIFSKDISVQSAFDKCKTQTTI